MLKNYLTLTLRHLLRHKVYSFINIFGLSIGLATCLLVFLFVENEYSFDRFHTQRSQVYRLNEVQTWEGIIPQKVALSMYPMGPNLVTDYAEIESFTRLIGQGEVPLEYQNQRVFMDQIFVVDSVFFDLFDFPLLYGDPLTALERPNSIVLTATDAKKLMGSMGGNIGEALGKTLVLKGNDTTMLTLTGILKDIPETSHLQFNALISNRSFPRLDEQNRERWGNNWLVTYLKLTPGTDVAALEAKFPEFLTKYMGEGATDGYQLFLQRLDQVHLGSADITHDYRNYKKFDGKYLSTFTILALFVLVIAGINFMNLSTARSAKRSREVGVRKTIGATRFHLAKQFLSESVIMAFISMILALLIVALVLPSLNQLSVRQMEITTLFKMPWGIALLGLTLLVGFLSGAYPAGFLASFDPVRSLKGTIRLRNQKFSLQNGLVVLQFAIAIALIVGTLLASSQLQHMVSMNPGFNKDQVVLLPTNREVNEHYEQLKNELEQLSTVKTVTASGQRLGSNIHQTGISYREDTAVQNLAISHVNVDYNYQEFYEIELLDGRGFSKAYAQDTEHGFLINETLAAKLGWEDPVGKPMKFNWQEEWGTVIGLVKDFNYNSLHHDINPLAMTVQPNWGYSEISVRVDPKSFSQQLSQIEGAWLASGTDRVFDYEFLDDHFAELYQADTQVSKLVSIIAILAILIACMGLFGLISITAERRTKEVGIRKVLGASIGDVMGLFSKDIALLVAIAFVLAVFPTWWFMQDWLENFAYRIDLNPGVFVLAGVIALLVAMGTIAYRTYRAASADPVKSLRYE